MDQPLKMSADHFQSIVIFTLGQLADDEPPAVLRKYLDAQIEHGGPEAKHHVALRRLQDLIDPAGKVKPQ